MKLTAKSRYTYVPRFNGNRLLPEPEQVTAEIIRPKAEDRNLLFSLDFERDPGLADFEGPARAPVTLKSRYRAGLILRSHVGVIKNLTVEEDGKDLAVSSGAGLAESTAFGAGALVQELVAEVLSDRLAEDEKKSTPPPSNSSMKDGPGNGGTPNTTGNGNGSVSGTSNGGSSVTT